MCQLGKQSISSVVVELQTDLLVKQGPLGVSFVVSPQREKRVSEPRYH